MRGTSTTTGEDEPHDVARNVFAVLSKAFQHNMLYDLAFEASNPTISIYANEVLLGALGWNAYDRYETEMRALLECATAT